MILEALAWTAALRVGLAWLPFRKVHDWVERRADLPDLRPAHQAAAEVEAVARALATAERRVPGARCLARAMAGRIMLARRGLHAELRWGVRMKTGSLPGAGRELDAHAWLESGGQPVYGQAQPGGFRPLGETAPPRSPDSGGAPL